MCRKGTLEKSATAEHTRKNHHPFKWEQTSVINQARYPKELLLKKPIHIQMTLAGDRFNTDTGLEVPGCWLAVLTSQEGRANRAEKPHFLTNVYDDYSYGRWIMMGRSQY